MADTGTIVLDEIAALSPATQSKLLRVLEERQFERLGGTETITISARLIALTNADLPRLVSDGQFREDLFFRLSVLTIPVPALRARPGDILPLADALLERGARVHGRMGVAFSDAVRKMLTLYSWPGNVRELRNAIERALVFSKGTSLIPEDFPESVRAADSTFGGALRSLDDMERDAIRATLEATRYKIGKSAQILGISRKTLLDKRKKYGLN
jgi:DNA-binding NtrC family response regulator